MRSGILGAMSASLARALSILGHPLVVLPMAVMLLAVDDGADRQRLSGLALLLGGLAGLVMAYSWWQVRRQHWRHVDASARTERRSLNRFLSIALAIAAVFAWTWASQRELALGLALSAALIALAMLSARWWKLSLHVAFAVFAAVLLARVSWQACVGGLAFAAAVAWSRWALSRHAPRDLIAGAVAGGSMGLQIGRAHV